MTNVIELAGFIKNIYGKVNPEVEEVGRICLMKGCFSLTLQVVNRLNELGVTVE